MDEKTKTILESLTKQGECNYSSEKQTLICRTINSDGNNHISWIDLEKLKPYHIRFLINHVNHFNKFGLSDGGKGPESINCAKIVVNNFTTTEKFRRYERISLPLI